MATNQQIIQRSLNKIGFESEQVDRKILVDSFSEFQDFISEIENNGMDLDYNFNSGLTEENGIDRRFFSAVTAIFAKRLSETYDVTTGPQLEAQASLGAQTLAKLTTRTPAWKQPNRMPIGSGNNKNGYEWRRYYSDVQVLPTTEE